MKKKLLFGLLLPLIVFTWGLSYGAPFNLTSNNSTAVIDPALQMGMSNWTVDGTDHLFQQWFWYRVGPTGGESSIDTLTLNSATQAAANILVLSYSNSDFDLSITYTLLGGSPGSKTSDIAETIGIFNTSGAALDFHFFQYSDFDLFGTAGNDIASHDNVNKISQSDPQGTLSETVAVPDPSHWQIAFFAAIRNSLTDGNPTTLSDAASPFGPGDITWAWQWDRVIAQGGAFIISKDKHLSGKIPEPISLILLGSGLAGVGLVRRFRKK